MQPKATGTSFRIWSTSIVPKYILGNSSKECMKSHYIQRCLYNKLLIMLLHSHGYKKNKKLFEGEEGSGVIVHFTTGIEYANLTLQPKAAECKA